MTATEAANLATREPTLDARPVPPMTLAEHWLDVWGQIGMYVVFLAQGHRTP